MKKGLIIVAIILFGIVVLVLVSGPILNALGVEVFCIAEENGRTKIVRCGGETSLTADTNPPELAADAQPILIDTDMAVDDWMAILYLLQRPDIDVRAITVTGVGEAHCEPGVQNALNLAALAGRPEIPVACGRETPLEGAHVFPQSWRDHVDALAGISIPASPSQPADQDAVELIASTVREAGGNLEIVTLGPLTNLAEAFLADPSLAEDIEQVTIMGGAFYMPGNVSDSLEAGIDNTAAEWNIYIDPNAAGIVVASGAPVTFVPLDASNHVLLDEGFFDRLADDRTTPEARFVHQILEQSLDFVRSGTYYFWDPLTAAIAVEESLGTVEEQRVMIVEEEGPESGATRIDEDGSPVRIVTAADGARFIIHFLDMLNSRVGE